MPETIRTPIFTRYELLEELGSGGMGAVYKARQKFVGRLVAFKVLPPALRNDDEALERFEREAAALGRLKHPNVTAVFDAGVEGGFPYLAMEFAEGQNLRRVLQARGRLSVEEVVRLGTEMGQALDHVQSQGLVHRDVKPSNIIIAPDGKAMLTDFGIAFAATLPRITQGAMGTPEFMSPEQADGKPLDIRSDLYGLGAVLYECLAGEVPFRREGESLTSLSKLLHQVLHEPAERLHERRPDVPLWLSDAVHCCMEKKPEDRFQTGAALAKALRQDRALPPDIPDPETPSVATPDPAAAPPTLSAPSTIEHPEAAPPGPQSEQATSRTRPPARAPSGKKPEGWTGSFIYRSHTKPDTEDEAPPQSLPEAPPQQALEKTTATKPAKHTAPSKRKPRAWTAFKIWFVLGVLLFIYLLLGEHLLPLEDGIPPLIGGLLGVNVLALTPALAGALTTLFSRSKEKKSRTGRGILLGALFGTVLSIAVTIAVAGLVLGETSNAFDDDLGLFLILAGATVATISAVFTGLFLGLKSLFASP